MQKLMFRILTYGLVAYFLICCKEKEKCIDREIELEYLGDITKLIADGYKCENKFDDLGIKELSKSKVLFSDVNYKIVYNGYKTRLLFDKRENLIIAINSVMPEFKVVESRPFSLYVLNDKLMPVYAVARLGDEKFAVYHFEYINNKIVLSKAAEKESENINICNLKYSQIIDLIHKMKSHFSYEHEHETLDDYFYKIPFWTEPRA